VSALSVAQSYYLPLAFDGSFPDQTSLRGQEENDGDGHVFTVSETANTINPALPTTHAPRRGRRWTQAAIRRLLNKYLAIFSLFRGGEHPFLRPYMQMLCALDTAP
jgi:hypothetical protein